MAMAREMDGDRLMMVSSWTEGDSGSRIGFGNVSARGTADGQKKKKFN